MLKKLADLLFTLFFPEEAAIKNWRVEDWRSTHGPMSDAEAIAYARKCAERVLHPDDAEQPKTGDWWADVYARERNKVINRAATGLGRDLKAKR